ncbi:hypothetical protein BASA61_003579 [Batrachochytrium salamandrivorans]|nr:hypothetical protein BASA61_003579 [Batrachochytrium salamandrivorans]KAH9265939.1 hypothetical protein BASA83_010847 [Batrachochytrium salamandrivorans]
MPAMIPVSLSRSHAISSLTTTSRSNTNGGFSSAALDPVVALCTARFAGGDVRTYWSTAGRKTGWLGQLAAVENFAKKLVVQGVALKQQQPRTCAVIATRQSLGQSDMLNWPGFIINSVLFIQLPPFAHWCPDPSGLFDSIRTLLELAEVCLSCTSVIVCIDASLQILPSTLCVFQQAGFELVHPQVYSFGNEFVLCGFEI